MEKNKFGLKPEWQNKPRLSQLDPNDPDYLDKKFGHLLKDSFFRRDSSPGTKIEQSLLQNSKIENKSRLTRVNEIRNFQSASVRSSAIQPKDKKIKKITGTKDGKKKKKRKKKVKIDAKEIERNLFKGKIFFVDVVQEKDHEVFRHFFNWQVKEMGAQTLKKLPKNYKKAKLKPDYIIWEDGLKSTIQYAQEHKDIVMVKPSWITNCLKQLKVLDLKSDPDYYFKEAEIDLYTRISRIDYDGCKVNTNHHWYQSRMHKAKPKKKAVLFTDPKEAYAQFLVEMAAEEEKKKEELKKNKKNVQSKKKKKLLDNKDQFGFTVSKGTAPSRNSKPSKQISLKDFFNGKEITVFGYTGGKIDNSKKKKFISLFCEVYNTKKRVNFVSTESLATINHYKAVILRTKIQNFISPGLAWALARSNPPYFKQFLTFYQNFQSSKKNTLQTASTRTKSSNLMTTTSWTTHLTRTTELNSSLSQSST